MPNINQMTGIDMDTGLRVTPPQREGQPDIPSGRGGSVIHADGDLSECARLHEEEVITNDSYELKKLYDRDKGIEYVIDIGANVGAFSYYIKQLYPNAKVISCEPEPHCMKWVKVNTKNKGIYVEKAVVGDPTLKEVTFNVCHWAGNHHVDGKFDMAQWSRYGCRVDSQITVPAITLQEVIDQNKFTKVDLLKIDTEGSEGDILEGIKPWLKNVKYIIGEWHSQKDLERIKDILKDTHKCKFEPAPHFKDLAGEPANGGIYAELK